MSESNHNRTRWAGTAFVALVSALGGCALQNGTVALSTADDEAVATVSTEGLSSYTREYTWEQSQPSTRMLRSAGNVCFLTGVQGNFRSTAERVKISNVRGYWYLTGSSHQAGVGGTARCFAYDSTKVIATQINDATQKGDLDLGAHRLCALSRVSGNFDGSGVVRVYQAASGHWFLQTSAASTELNGGALCMDDDAVASLRVSREFSVNGGEPVIIADHLSPKHTGPTEPLQGPACFLTKMAGKFASADQSVDAYVASAAGAWNFYLRAKGASPDVAASSVCLH